MQTDLHILTQFAGPESEVEFRDCIELLSCNGMVNLDLSSHGLCNWSWSWNWGLTMNMNWIWIWKFLEGWICNEHAGFEVGHISMMNTMTRSEIEIRVRLEFMSVPVLKAVWSAVTTMVEPSYTAGLPHVPPHSLIHCAFNLQTYQKLLDIHWPQSSLIYLSNTVGYSVDRSKIA